MTFRTFSILMLLALLLVSVAPVAAQDDTIACEEGFTLYTNPLLWEETTDGVCIPENPERVVIANHPTYLLDNTLALGVKPVGTAIYLDRFAVAPYLADEVDGIEYVGSFNEPNLEVILELEPDLILSTTFREEFYDQLSAIAPTILLEWDQVSWQDFLLATGDALNRSEEAETLLAEYTERVEVLAETIQELDAVPTISVVRVRPANLRFYVVSSLVGSVLQDADLPRPEAQNIDEEGTLFQVISEEEIDLLDADTIFVWGATDGSDETMAALQENPLWQQLDGVQNDRVFFVEEAFWFAPGIEGVHLLLDDLFRYVAGVDPQDISPNPFLIEATPEPETTEEASE